MWSCQKCGFRTVNKRGDNSTDCRPSAVLKTQTIYYVQTNLLLQTNYTIAYKPIIYNQFNVKMFTHIVDSADRIVIKNYNSVLLSNRPGTRFTSCLLIIWFRQFRDRIYVIDSLIEYLKLNKNEKD